MNQQNKENFLGDRKTEKEQTKNSAWKVERSNYTNYSQRIPHLHLEHAHHN